MLVCLDPRVRHFHMGSNLQPQQSGSNLQLREPFVPAGVEEDIGEHNYQLGEHPCRPDFHNPPRAWGKFSLASQNSKMTDPGKTGVPFGKAARQEHRILLVYQTCKDWYELE